VIGNSLRLASRDKLLLEPVILFPEDPNYAYHIDTIGSGGDEDQLIYLTYYATEKDRALLGQEIGQMTSFQLGSGHHHLTGIRLLPRPSPRHPGLLSVTFGLPGSLPPLDHNSILK
jgi:hypothetical protein